MIGSFCHPTSLNWRSGKQTQTWLGLKHTIVRPDDLSSTTGASAIIGACLSCKQHGHPLTATRASFRLLPLAYFRPEGLLLQLLAPWRLLAKPSDQLREPSLSTRTAFRGSEEPRFHLPSDHVAPSAHRRNLSRSC